MVFFLALLFFLLLITVNEGTEENTIEFKGTRGPLLPGRVSLPLPPETEQRHA